MLLRKEVGYKIDLQEDGRFLLKVWNPKRNNWDISFHASFEEAKSEVDRSSMARGLFAKKE